MARTKVRVDVFSRLWVSSLRTECFAGGILSPCQ